MKQAFGEVPSRYYFDSIKKDIEDSKDEVMTNPIYIILNLCRVLAYKKENLVLSKEEGGKWAIENILFNYKGLVKEAIRCYSSEVEMKPNKKLALEFCDYMIKEIEG